MSSEGKADLQKKGNGVHGINTSNSQILHSKMVI